MKKGIAGLMLALSAYCAPALANEPDGLSDATHLREAVIEQAMSAVGLPYRFGGNSRTDFDCSGLTQWAFQAADVHLPRKLSEILKTGTPVPAEAAEPGDLLIYEWGSRKRSRLHVTILAAPGWVIHASPKHRKVSLTDVDRPVWRRRLVGAIRLIPSA